MGEVVRERASESNRTSPKRYPLAALVEASGMSEAELGRRVGLSGSSLTKARRDGLIESAADRYACRAGLVPWLVWSDWLEDAFVECAAEDCCERFVPRDKANIWCSRRCYQRVKMRRYRATEAGRENNRKWRKAWYAECAAYDIEQSRRRRQRVSA